MVRHEVRLQETQIARLNERLTGTLGRSTRRERSTGKDISRTCSWCMVMVVSCSIHSKTLSRDQLKHRKSPNTASIPHPPDVYIRTVAGMSIRVHLGRQHGQTDRKNSAARLAF